MPVETVTKRSLRFEILKALAGSASHQHKFNLLGKSNVQGDLERQLGVRFAGDQRHLAAVAFAELETAGLIRPTYDDLIAPELWVTVTDSGRSVLARNSVEALDEVLERPIIELAQKKELEQKFKILYSPAQAAKDFTEWISADSSGSQVAVLYIDIDNFKKLNTAHTETTVDETLLPEFQRTLDNLVKHRGAAYRQGGEEFLVALPNHTKDEAVAFAERLRREISEQPFRVYSEEAVITVSVGVAAYPDDGATFAEVLRAANIAEHEAKAAGRNVVVVSE